MMPIIKPGQYVLLEPVADKELEVGDVVLAKVKASIYLHKVTALDGERVQIGNNRGHINGWTVKHNVYGRATSVKS